MPRKTLPEFKEGDELSAQKLTELREAIQRLTPNAGQSSGLSISESPYGTAYRMDRETDRYLAKTTSTITARSGSTIGTGTATVSYITGTAITDTSTEYTVRNFSSTTGGIASGTYVWIQQDVNGDWFITAVDCGN